MTLADEIMDICSELAEVEAPYHRLIDIDILHRLAQDIESHLLNDARMQALALASYRYYESKIRAQCVPALKGEDVLATA